MMPGWDPMPLETSMTRPALLLPALLLLAACAGGEGDKSTLPTDDTGSTTPPAMVSVFPSGDSEWAGTAEVLGTDVDTTVSLTRTGSVVEGVASLVFSGTALTFTLTGTVDLQSNRLALAPVEWVGEDPGLEMVGLEATYDPDSGTLTGLVRDPDYWEGPTPSGGPITLSTTTPAEEVELASITADPVVTEAGLSFSGTQLCSSAQRTVSGTIARGSDGQLTGTLAVDEEDGTYMGTFGFVGVEDAASGGMTWLPTVWTDDGEDATNYSNYFTHGTVSESGYTATLLIGAAAICTPDGFEVSFDG